MNKPDTWPHHRIYRRVHDYLALHAQAKKIIESNADWKTKYELIFSDDVSTLMHSMFHVDYVDPNTDYEDDIRAWFSAVSEKAAELQKVADALEQGS